MMKKKSTLEKLTPFVVGTCMLTLVASCGSDDDDSSSSTAQSEQQEGMFTGVLTPVNSQVTDGSSSAAASSSAASSVASAASSAATDVAAAASSAASAVASAASSAATGGLSSLMAIGGTVTVNHIGDNFQVMVDTTEATAASHPQFIYTGSRCPTAADDANGDGYVDVVEAMTASGQMLVPLDNDLKAQDAGGTFPSGANYSYDESTSYATMLADLQAPDTNTSDTLVKLGAGQDLNIGSRVVIVHGVPASTTLPATVQGVGTLTAQQTLPIACAVLTFASSTEAAAASAASTAAAAASSAASAASAAAASAASAASTAEAAAASAASAAASSAGSTTGTTTGM